MGPGLPGIGQGSQPCRSNAPCRRAKNQTIRRRKPGAMKTRPVQAAATLEFLLISIRVFRQPVGKIAANRVSKKSAAVVFRRLGGIEQLKARAN
jgi:hypothetical protein